MQDVLEELSSGFCMALCRLVVHNACLTWFIGGGDALAFAGVQRESFVDFADVWLQDHLRRSHRSVQSCVVHGKSLVGANTNNVSACLMSEVRRLRCIVEQLGAIMPGDCSSRWCVLGRLTPDSAEWDRIAWWLDTRV